VKKTNIHAERLKRIRPYVDFNYNLNKPLSKYAKAKIKRYYDEIDSLSARGHIIYRPRNKARRKAAIEYAGQDKSLTQLKTVLIPVANPEKRPQLKFKNNKLILKGEFVTTEIIPFDQFELIKDPEKHAAQVISALPNDARFTIRVGEGGRFEIPQDIEKSRIPSRVQILTTNYNDKDRNDYFGNWLFGVQMHTFDNQADFSEYQDAKFKAKKKLKKQRQSAKRKKK
jgi:hypothetical protein